MPLDAQLRYHGRAQQPHRVSCARWPTHQPTERATGGAARTSITTNTTSTARSHIQCKPTLILVLPARCPPSPPPTQPPPLQSPRPHPCRSHSSLPHLAHPPPPSHLPPPPP
eukprot:3754245-Pyramimonas_sp.AAC.1